MKHYKKSEKPRKRQKRLKQLKVLSILFTIALLATVVTVYRDYQARPGFLEEIWIADRGADYITVAWKKPRNVDKYVITYNGEINVVSGRKKEATISGLTEDTEYRISVRADSKEREGFEALEELARTKKTQSIEGEDTQMKFAGRPVDLKQIAKTTLTYSPGNGYTITEDGKVIFTRSGEITVKAEANETEEYAGAAKDIKVEVLDAVNVNASGAKPHVFYKLNKNNCECVLDIKGTADATVPQAFIYADGRYIVTYVKNDKNQKIISFGEKKMVNTPATDLGHANGLTFMDGRCYLVQGTNNRCITFDLPNNNYSGFNLKYDASGIAYDEIGGTLYTSSRRDLVAYDKNHKVVNRIGRVDRNIKYYVQDCAAYNGILMQGVSGAGFVGTNYIDFYDMDNGRYLGSAECQLDEIESIIVDEKGYIEVLSNTKGAQDHIWKTPINLKSLVEE